VRWLQDAGVKVQFIQLADLGIHGNRHMVMLEKNNLKVAAVVRDWVVTNIR